MKTASKWLALFAILALAASGCSAASSLMPAATETPTPTTLALGSSTGGSGGSESDQSEAEEPVEPASGPDSSASAQCLIGTWRVVHESFAGYMEDALDTPAEGAIDFEVQSGRGDMFMTFSPDGQYSVSSEDFEIDLQIVGLAEFTFLVQAEGTASYAADEEAVAAWGFNYDSSAAGSGEVLDLSQVSSQAELTLTPESLFAYAESEGYSWTVEGAPEDAGASPYYCSGNTLIFGPEDYQPVEWERVS